MTVFVSTFFAPCAPKRPANFIVLKYFLLGLLISNSIESILIIPKILDVLDQSAIQARELEEMDIKRTELKELVAEKEKEAQVFEKEKQRELDVLLQKASQGQHRNQEEESEEEEEEMEHRGQGAKEHHGKKVHHSRVLAKQHGKKNHNKSDHPEVRKRPQRLETGNNLVAVFMLFYGSATLCLGIPAIFKESVQLLRVLMYLSCLGTLTLVSAKFSLLMLMSVVKDMAIAALTYQYVQMIVASTPPTDASAGVLGGQAAGATAVAATSAGAMPQAGVNPFPTATAANVMVDYSQPATGYNPTGQTTSGW